jgi:RNA polymerase sigma factor (sigma-70 family)
MTPKFKKTKTKGPSNLDLTDDQLILFTAHRHLIRQIAAKYSQRSDIRDDLRQVGQTGLIRAIKTFKPEHGVPLGAYATKLVKNACTSYLKKHPQPAEHIEDEFPGLNEEGLPRTRLQVFENSAARREEQPDHSETFDLLRYRLSHSGLDRTELKVMALRLRNQSFEKIGKRLRMSTTSTHDLYKKIEAKLRKRNAPKRNDSKKPRKRESLIP